MTELATHPYHLAMFSEPLSDTHYNAVSGPGVDFTAASLSGSTLTIGSAMIPVHDLRRSMMSFVPTSRQNLRDGSSAASANTKNLTGRGSWQAVGRFRVNTANNDTYDVFMNDDTGYRVFHVGYPDGKTITGVAVIESVAQEAVNDAGDFIITVTFNNAGDVKPTWA